MNNQDQKQCTCANWQETGDCDVFGFPIAYKLHEQDCVIKEQNKSMSEKETALELRFVVTESAIVMQVVGFNKIALGYDRERNLAVEILNDIFKKTGVVPQTFLYCNVSFEQHKKILNDFAASGAFHSDDEPPVPRLQRVPYDTMFPHYRIFDEAGQSEMLSGYDIKQLEAIIGVEIPIYTPQPKPRFSGVWTREFPQEVKLEDLQVSTLETNEGWINSFINTTVSSAIDQCNKLQSVSGVEIWKFVMLREG